MSTSRSERRNVFFASIKERVRLNPYSDKETYHLVLDISGSGVRYEVGDSVGIYPENDPEEVEKIIAAVEGGETLRQFLLREANITHLSARLLSGYPTLAALLQANRYTPDGVRQLLPPLLPRYYSIASAQTCVGEELHLLVALVRHPEGAPFAYGVSSHYLCVRAPLLQPLVPLFIQPSRHFSLPLESANSPLIMIGPGTGLAPFRAFMQERGYHKNWLFFGERSGAHDFYYRSFWESLVAENRLRLDCAFSRDQSEKIYVQHRLQERAAELWAWLEEGAYLFVCGNASSMAKSVDQTLHTLICQEANMAADQAKEYLKYLKRAGRYQRDVY